MRREEVQEIDLKLRESSTLGLELCFISFIHPPKPYFPFEDHKACTSWGGLATSHLISGCLVCQASHSPELHGYHGGQDKVTLPLPSRKTISPLQKGILKSLQALTPFSLISTPICPCSPKLFHATLLAMQPWVFERKIEHLLWHVDYLLTAEGVFTYWWITFIAQVLLHFSVNLLIQCPKRRAVSSPLYRWGNWGIEWLSNLSEVTQVKQ